MKQLKYKTNEKQDEQEIHVHREQQFGNTI